MPYVRSAFLLLGIIALTSEDLTRAFSFATARVGSRWTQDSPLQPNTELKIGETLRQTITKGQVQSFYFNAGANEFAELTFEWQGIDLNVSVNNSSGTQVLPASILVSAPGPVSVVVKTEKAGQYKVDVSTPVRFRVSGTYKVRLETVRTLTFSDQDRISAQNLIAVARPKPPAEAIETYKQALSLWRNLQNAHAEAQTLLLMGNAYRAKADTKNAEANYRVAAAKWNETSNKRGEGYAYLSLALLFRSESAKEALAPYEHAESLFEEIGDRRGRADALYGRAYALMLIGRTVEALGILQQAAEIRRDDEDRLGQALVLNMMADGYRLLSDHSKSLSLYDDAVKAVEGLEHPVLEASLINGKALVIDDQGHWEAAELEYVRALNVLESFLKKPVIEACGQKPSPSQVSPCRTAAFFLINLGEVYNSLGEPTKALTQLNNSLSIHDALGETNASGRGEVRLHLGYTHFLLARNLEALTIYEKALEFKKAAGEDKSVALIYTYMGMAQVARNEPKAGLDNYQKALPILEKSGDKRSVAITLDKIGTVFSLLGNRTEASSHFAKALSSWRQIKDPDGEASTLYNIAEAEKQSGNLTAAIQNSEAAIKLVESLRTRIASEKFRVSYLAEKKRYYELAVDLRMSLGKSTSDNSLIAAAFESNEMSRARVLLDSLNEAFLAHSSFNQTATPKSVQLIKQRSDLVERLSAKARARTSLLSSAQPNDSLTVINDQINQLTEKLDSLDRRIKSETPQADALLRPQPATLRQIQQQLDRDTVLLEFALGEKRSYGWVVTPDEIRGIELAPRHEIESIATRLLHALTAHTREEPNETFQQQTLRWEKADKEAAAAATLLSKMVLEPAGALLGQKRLVIVADGTLQLVPFGVLPEPANSPIAMNAPTPILIQNRDVVSLPSASVLTLQRRQLANRKPAPLSLAVIADPVFDIQDERAVKALSSREPYRKDSTPSEPPKSNDKALTAALRDVGLNPNIPLRRLVKSRDEALDIARVVPGDNFQGLDFDASRATVTSGALSKYRYVHFATHGLLDLDHPELSGIVLSMFDKRGNQQDGYLRLYEIYNLNLPAELVVLSGCQTGIGRQVRGEGLIALTRGFMHAGAARVVASLWKVDDSATAELMAQFYKEMFKNGKRPPAALRAAQIHLSQQRRWQSPHYWAGFLLQGEWR